MDWGQRRTRDRYFAQVCNGCGGALLERPVRLARELNNRAWHLSEMSGAIVAVIACSSQPTASDVAPRCSSGCLHSHARVVRVVPQERWPVNRETVALALVTSSFEVVFVTRRASILNQSQTSAAT